MYLTTTFLANFGWQTALAIAFIVTAVIALVLNLWHFFVHLKIEALKQRIEALEAKVDAKDTKIFSLANRLETLETKNAQQRKDISKLGKKVGENIVYVG